MTEKSLKVFFNYTIYSLAILLVFLLVFEQYLKIPSLINWLGRWHPLILHFPIVLIFVTIVQYWRMDKNITWYLAITTLFTLVSAVTGFILSLDGNSKGNIIITHQWLGIGVSFLMVVWYFKFSKLKDKSIKSLLGLLVVFIVLTGHYGGMVTHGQDFLSFGKSSNEKMLTLPDNPNIYTHFVQPIFDKKCVSCHNENKAKGELILSSYNSLLKGGESGPLMNDLENTLLHRIELPREDDDHMPPSDEEQLTESEVAILKNWFELGASESLAFTELDPESGIFKIVQNKINESKAQSWSDLPEVTDKDLHALNSDYCTIRRLYHGANALQVLIFPQKNYSIKVLQNLKPVSNNIIELNLFDLPLTGKEMKLLNSFEHLESLNIRGCTITEEDFNELEYLKNLKVLKAYDTQLGDEVVDRLASFTSLRDLYVFNTNITSSGVDNLRSKNKNLNIMIEATEANDFKAVLPPPTLEPARYFFRDPFYVKFEHPLNQIDFRYTTDSKDPDNNSAIVSDSLLIDKNCTLKFFASKVGWESSIIDSMTFLRSNQIPPRFKLEYPPNEKYIGKGGQLLFDHEKGPMNFGDSSWMAYLENDFILSCEFDEIFTLNGVILSSMVHTDPYLFPPSQIMVYGGMDAGNLRILGTLRPSEIKEREEQHFEYYHCAFQPCEVKFIKVIVQPLHKIPIWHQGKGERGWFFIDEVVFKSVEGV